MSARQPWATRRHQQCDIRSAVPSDRGRVEHFLAAMDRYGLYQRHFAHSEAANQALLTRMGLIDHRQRVAVLALAQDGNVIGQGEYVAENGAAEFALMVLPQYRAHGIGTQMLQALLDIALAAGMDSMHGMIKAANGGAIRVARVCGFQAAAGDDRAVVIVSLTLPARVHAAPHRPAAETPDYPPTAYRHDPDRIPLHRRAGPRAPFWAGGGQVQRVPTDALGSGEEARG